MSVARTIEISSLSPGGFQEAIAQGIARAHQTIRNITGAWVKDQHVVVEGGAITGYRVTLLVTFLLDDIGTRRLEQAEAALHEVPQVSVSELDA